MRGLYTYTYICVYLTPPRNRTSTQHKPPAGDLTAELWTDRSPQCRTSSSQGRGKGRPPLCESRGRGQTPISWSLRFTQWGRPRAGKRVKTHTKIPNRQTGKTCRARRNFTRKDTFYKVGGDPRPPETQEDKHRVLGIHRSPPGTAPVRAGPCGRPPGTDSALPWAARASFGLCRLEMFWVPDHERSFASPHRTVVMSHAGGLVPHFGGKARPASLERGLGDGKQPPGCPLLRQGSRALSALRPLGFGDGARGPIQVRPEATPGARSSVRGTVSQEASPHLLRWAGLPCAGEWLQNTGTEPTTSGHSHDLRSRPAHLLRAPGPSSASGSPTRDSEGTEVRARGKSQQEAVSRLTRASHAFSVCGTDAHVHTGSGSCPAPGFDGTLKGDWPSEAS